jgi:hypothetical protein
MKLKIVQGELEHRRLKLLYQKTNKIRVARDVAKGVRRQRLVAQMQDKAPASINSAKRKHARKQHRLRFNSSEKLPKGDPTLPYQISDRNDTFLDIYKWINENDGDPAVVVRVFNFNLCLID